MTDSVSELVKRAHSLMVEEREQLVEKLLESLNGSNAGELDSAWESEIERRLAAYDRGEVKAIDAEVVFAEAARIAK